MSQEHTRRNLLKSSVLAAVAVIADSARGANPQSTIRNPQSAKPLKLGLMSYNARQGLGYRHDHQELQGDRLRAHRAAHHPRPRRRSDDEQGAAADRPQTLRGRGTQDQSGQRLRLSLSGCRPAAEGDRGHEGIRDPRAGRRGPRLSRLSQRPAGRQGHSRKSRPCGRSARRWRKSARSPTSTASRSPSKSTAAAPTSSPRSSRWWTTPSAPMPISIGTAMPNDAKGPGLRRQLRLRQGPHRQRAHARVVRQLPLSPALRAAPAVGL